MTIEVSQDARQVLADRGFDPVLGARPLRRTIAREIEDPLSERILFNEIRPGQTIYVDVEGEGADAEFTFKGVSENRVPVKVGADDEDETGAIAEAGPANAAASHSAGDNTDGGAAREAGAETSTDS